MNIGFDLDKVFIDYPPFVPAKLINWLYKHDFREIFSSKDSLEGLFGEEHFNGKPLSYHIPRHPLEIFIRKLSHFPLLRPQIDESTDFLHHFPNNPQNYQLFLISSRYSFLEKLTYTLLKKYNIFNYFKSINLNIKDEQPHLFKEKAIKRLKVSLYVDDDIHLLKYLTAKLPNTKFFWYNTSTDKKAPKGIISIKALNEIKNYLK